MFDYFRSSDNSRNGNISSDMSIRCLVGLLCFVFFRICILKAKMYVDIDNYFAGITLSAGYSPVAYFQHSHPVISLLAGLLVSLFPSADGFASVCRLFVFFAFTAFLVCILVNVKSTKRGACICVIFTLISASLSLGNANYTIQAAYVGACSLFLFFESTGKDNKRILRIVGSILFVFAAMIRVEAALLSLPYLLLGILVESNKKCDGSFKRLVVLFSKSILLPVLALLLVVGSNKVFWNEYSADSIAFNKYRISIADYPTKSVSEIDMQSASFSENDYSCVSHQIVGDTDFFTVERLMEMSNKTKISFIEALKETHLNSVLYSIAASLASLTCVIILLACLTMMINVPFDRSMLIKLILCLSGTAVIFLFFAIRKRLPNRVAISILLQVVPVLSIEMINSEQRTKLGKGKLRLTKLLSVAMIVVVTISIVNNFDYRRVSSALTSNPNMSEEEYRQYFDRDTKYLCSNGFIFESVAKSGKLPSREFLSHFIVFSGWEYGQLYFLDYLERLGIENPIAALVSDSDVLLIASDPSLISQFCTEHYDRIERINQIGEINGVPLWNY